MSLFDLLCVDIEIVFVEEGAGFDHLLEWFVVVGAALMLDGELPHENFAGLHIGMTIKLLIKILTR